MAPLARSVYWALTELPARLEAAFPPAALVPAAGSLVQASWQPATLPQAGGNETLRSDQCPQSFMQKQYVPRVATVSSSMN